MKDLPSLRGVVQGLMPATLDWLRRMVEINSWTENRDGVNRVGHLTEECFAGLGFQAERVPSTNPAWGDHLVLTRPGSSALSVAMVSHLDTVFPPEEEASHGFHWQPEGDRIYGPGTHDIKGGTVMMWMVLEALRAWSPATFERTTWRLFFNSSEEALSHDFGDVVLARCDTGTRAALVFEAEGRSEGIRRLVVARKGRATWRITVQGRGAHAGGKHAHGANAIVQLARTLTQVATFTAYDRQLTFNVGRITGGTGLNRVPHEAVAEGEMRAFSAEVFTAAKQALLALEGPGDVRSPADGFACHVVPEILSESQPWPRNPATDALLALWQQAGAEIGEEVAGEERGGLSDGNLLCGRLPTIDGLGPWGDNDHCSERSADGSKVPEYVSVASFAPKAMLNAVAIARLAEATPSPGS